MRYLLTIVGTALLLSACASSTGAGPECTDQSQCPVGQLCEAGQCVVSCAANGCPPGFVCLPTGACQRAADGCVTDADCVSFCDEKSECTAVCANGTCIGTECVEGDMKSCYDGCHPGVKVCTKGLLQPCDAKPVEPEICHDNLDNDCNGLIDEECPVCDPGEEEVCDFGCGNGTKVCTAEGQWTDCSAPTECTCVADEVKTEPCGDRCGSEEIECGLDGTWKSLTGICDNEKECAPGIEEQLPCGSCAWQIRTCQDDCTWGVLSECIQTAACVPGAVDLQSCGACGTMEAVCNEDCTWGPYADCIDNPGSACAVGEPEYQACEKCGFKTKTCLDGCNFSDYGACEDKGECETGSKDFQDCGNCGIRERTCSDSCYWGSWSTCSEPLGACDPEGSPESKSCGSSAVGLCQFGQQTRDCQIDCTWDEWSPCLGSIEPGELNEICGNTLDEDCNGADKEQDDALEPNDSCYTCTDLGTQPEDDDIPVLLTPTTDNPQDSDFFCFTVSDFFGLSEEIVIELTSQAFGLDNDILLYKGKDNCAAGTPIAVDDDYPVLGNADEKIVWEESNFSDSGEYVVEVRPYGSIGACYDPYHLSIYGLH